MDRERIKNIQNIDPNYDLRIWNSCERFSLKDIPSILNTLTGKRYKVNIERLNDFWTEKDGPPNDPELRQDVLDDHGRDTIYVEDDGKVYATDHFSYMNRKESLDDWCLWNEIPFDCLDLME